MTVGSPTRPALSKAFCVALVSSTEMLEVKIREGYREMGVFASLTASDEERKQNHALH